MPAITARLVTHTDSTAQLHLENSSGIPWGGDVRLESHSAVLGTAPATVLSTQTVDISLSAPLRETLRVVFDHANSWLPSLVKARLGTPPSQTISP